MSSERDTCVLTEHPPWVVVFFYPWSFVASAAVDDVAGGAHLVAHMSMQQAAKLSVLLCFSFVGFFSLFQATPAGPWVIAFFVTEARRPKGDRQAPALTCSTHTHTHTHTHTNSSLPFPLEPGHLLGSFSSSQPVVCCNLVDIVNKKTQKKPSSSSSVIILLVIFSSARHISGWSLKFPPLSLFLLHFCITVKLFFQFTFQKKDKIT